MTPTGQSRNLRTSCRNHANEYGRNTGKRGNSPRGATAARHWVTPRARRSEKSLAEWPIEARPVARNQGNPDAQLQTAGCRARDLECDRPPSAVLVAMISGESRLRRPNGCLPAESLLPPSSAFTCVKAGPSQRRRKAASLSRIFTLSLPPMPLHVYRLERLVPVGFAFLEGTRCWEETIVS
jgi:hypothetical protein